MADLPGCTTPIVNAGNIVDAELVCFNAGQSPLLQVTVYDQAGVIVSGPIFRDPLTGIPVVPGGNPIPCPSGIPIEDCGEEGPAVVATICGTVDVSLAVPVPMRAQRANLLGVGTWAVGVDTAGKVRSVSIRRRPGGSAGGVTISDNNGTVTTLLVGETETWGINALEDSIAAPLSVTGTVSTDVIIVWTEV